MDDAQRIIDI